MTLYSTIQVLSLLPRLFGCISFTKTVHWACGHIGITRSHRLSSSAGIWTCKRRCSFLLLAELSHRGHQFCYSLVDRASKQEFDRVSSGKQRTNPQTQSTLSTIGFLIYYTYITRAYVSYNSRGIMGHDPHT